ncbi:hypothetical protein ELI30_19785 [Rhizobium leguminosarum]|uniref:hypothetical protein n=1 Tax=Rhizobium leguminosarum TaxID=384 RepID=UPI001031D435|nr:hypothetical protein [Rhizobium leguminosarum]TAV50394.1 hypothetical protein ELI32_20485 [Rhizobium leguminosarum]TAV59756.1 hypothetical protein ELI31_19010 [Rhizobium leguminosarum]TAV70804.1 hypothetical protein ELI30_19785 [Rhizobium leguminosarum]TAY68423.1 hypothetical protein ELH82_20675 [Rhizobium leguminosarum]
MSEDARIKLNSLLKQAYDQRARAQANLNTINKFIAEMEAAAKTLAELDEGVPLNPVENSEDTPKIRKRSRPAALAFTSKKNPDKRDVAAQVAAMLMDSDKPLSRREIYENLKAAGIEIRGKDPEMVLSTMLWRAGEEFSIENKKGMGYILKGKHYGILG